VAEEVQHEDEDVWPGLPVGFVDSREREDFYFSISRSLFSDPSKRPPPFPPLHSRPIDLYLLYATLSATAGAAASRLLASRRAAAWASRH